MDIKPAHIAIAALALILLLKRHRIADWFAKNTNQQEVTPQLQYEIDCVKAELDAINFKIKGYSEEAKDQVDIICANAQLYAEAERYAEVNHTTIRKALFFLSQDRADTRIAS